MGIASASIYAAFGSKAELFRQTMGAVRGDQGRAAEEALREQPTARGAIEAMLGATADEITRPDDAALLPAHPGRADRRGGEPRDP